MRAGAGRMRGRWPRCWCSRACSSVCPARAVSSSSSDTTEGTFQQGGELRLAAVDVRDFDPAAAIPTNQAEMITIDLLYDSLTVFPTGLERRGRSRCERKVSSRRRDRRIRIVAASITPNVDSTVWTVTLADRTFSDGSPDRCRRCEGDVRAPGQEGQYLVGRGQARDHQRLSGCGHGRRRGHERAAGARRPPVADHFARAVRAVARAVGVAVVRDRAQGGRRPG